MSRRTIRNLPLPAEALFIGCKCGTEFIVLPHEVAALEAAGVKCPMCRTEDETPGPPLRDIVAALEARPWSELTDKELNLMASYARMRGEIAKAEADKLNGLLAKRQQRKAS